MRILGVRFKNLNSLAGEWQVDFTHPDYASDGIFAITGPTGAGKTTILDAVCLGLYGRTPRLEAVTKSSNEIMSRQTGECFAEVTFETQKGRFRCHWSQHRARRQAEGELQPARHEIADADSGAVLESKITQVREFIEKATGMDFERFTRSMLLAQGGFAAFLQADPDKRAPVLEQITGTEIYSLISMKVHERRAEERNRLDLLQAEFKGIRVLGEGEERDLQTALKEKQTLEVELEGRVEGLRNAALWLERVAALEREITELDRLLLDFAERRLAFAPESIRLEKSRKALGLEGDYRGVAALRVQQEGETQEFTGACAVLPGKERCCAAVLTLKQAAETGLNEARTRQAAEAEVIKKVRDLDVRLGEQKKQVEENARAIAEIEVQGKGYRSNIESLEQALKQVQTDLDAIRDYQDKHAADAALLTGLAVIAKEFESLRDCEAKHARACGELAAAAGKEKSAASACRQLEADHERSRVAFEAGRTELGCLTEEIGAILKGRDIGRWRDEADALKERERILIQVGETIDRIDKTDRALDGLKTVQETLQADQQKLSGEIKTSSERKAILEKETGTLEMEVSLLGRIRDLEEERRRLEDGRPCPLCGATDHPYAKGNLPEVNRAEAELKKTKAESKKVSETLGRLAAELAKAATEIRHAEKEMGERQTARDTDEKTCGDLLLKLGIEPAPEGRAGKVRELLDVVRTKIAETAAVVAVAEGKGREEKTAQAALETMRAQFEKQGKALQEARHQLETASREHERRTGERDVAAEETRKAQTAALQRVEPCGVTGIPATGLDAVLRDLTGRRDAWQAGQDEKTAAEKRIGEVKAALDKDSALLASLERDLTARCRDRDDLLRQVESLGASRRELFGEKNADREEKRLAEAVDRTGRTFEKAREEYGKIEKEIGALKEKIALLKEKTGKRAEELAQAERNLTERIHKAGFADEAGYLSACLTEEARERLADRETALVREKTGLDARRRERAEALAAERGKRLTDQPGETLREAIGACESNLRQIRVDIGAIKNSLGENEKLKEKQQDHIRALDARKKECARWDDLHLLIGSADGKKFRNFAQGLTFEMMTVHANRQLKKMTDRYLLIRDPSQPLELNVIDNYQAGEIRSTKNLSGGESFIVSLALALGLSQMASRNVRVDSLFLDEGFGTLDDEALETALSTLGGLHQEGKLIGIISHVTALKERIGTQIQVTPGTGGRSSLAGPGCRRI
ncbi:MAG: AAA family ATPase [Deltaproteobacteria bacterium]|nr:AAA family ATPase [Deltaproteobacteria bacterium]